MITLRKFEVPVYLRKSDFYESLSEDEDDEFSIPANCFKANTNITDEDSFRNLLSTLRFWGVKSTPHVVFYFAMFTDCYYVDSLAAEFGAELTYLNVINTVISKSEAWQRYWVRETTKHGELELLKYLHTIPRYRHESSMTSLCSTAASNGHLHCLKYLHGQLEPHDLVHYRPEDICSSAVYGGHYDCFEYAFDAEVNIQKYSSCLLEAIEGDFVNIVSFLNSRSCKLTTEEIYSIKTARGVQIIHDLGLYNWAKHDMRASFKNTTYAAMFRMYRLGCPFSRKLLDNPDFRKDCVHALVTGTSLLTVLVFFLVAGWLIFTRDASHDF